MIALLIVGSYFAIGALAAMDRARREATMARQHYESHGWHNIYNEQTSTSSDYPEVLVLYVVLWPMVLPVAFAGVVFEGQRQRGLEADRKLRLAEAQQRADAHEIERIIAESNL
jgi:hypothetical protein